MYCGYCLQSVVTMPMGNGFHPINGPYILGLNVKIGSQTCGIAD